VNWASEQRSEARSGHRRIGRRRFELGLSRVWVARLAHWATGDLVPKTKPTGCFKGGLKSTNHWSRTDCLRVILYISAQLTAKPRLCSIDTTKGNCRRERLDQISRHRHIEGGASVY
jgi:hypothetical protein